MQVAHYPAPEHRTAALAQQAAALYLSLYFVPAVLHRDATLMRTLVDRCARALIVFLRLPLPFWYLQTCRRTQEPSQLIHESASKSAPAVEFSQGHRLTRYSISAGMISLHMQP